MVYQFKAGTRWGVDANTVGTICEDLANKGQLTAENLVNVSREETAPLHKCFTWDNSIAAEKYRQQEARCLIGSVEIVLKENTQPVRGFYNLSLDVRTPEYESTEVVLHEVDRREILLEKAKRELRSFKLKYEILTELAKIFDDIDNLD